MFLRNLAFALAFSLTIAAPIRGDVPLPANVLDPPTAPEAWNVIRLATANVERLLRENRLGEITAQISLCSPALRTLAKNDQPPDRGLRLKAASQRGLAFIDAVAAASVANDRAAATKAFSEWRDLLRETAKEFDAKIVSADIFFCPMHPDFVSTDAATPCGKCGMKLLPRRIPYSFIYVPPGEPSMHLTAVADGPLTAGQKTGVKVQIKRRDGSPGLLEDLMVMHTQPIHLLIIDPSLEDYHHEHPTPTATPGEYAFSFTPTKSSLYRIWADLVPVATGVQEYPTVELPGTAKSDPIGSRSGRYTTTVDGLNFRLTFADGALPRSQQVRAMKIEIVDTNAQPVRRLEPLMNAFAHLVGFYDDYRTVVHLHPEGGDILRADLRGGPVLNFKFYPPQAGFLRLFCQVVVDGKTIFAPFNVNVAP
jgi:hypothetical protein